MFALRRPCVDCPFRKAGGVRLRPDRVREVAACFTGTDGATFPCHRTVEQTTDDNGDDAIANMADVQMCAGGLIFGDKIQGDRPNRMIQLGMRLLRYDPATLVDRDAVFDSLDDMLSTAL